MHGPAQKGEVTTHKAHQLEVSSPESGQVSPEQAARRPKTLLERPHCSALQDAANIPAVSVGARSNNVPSEAVAASSHKTLPPHSPSLAIAHVSLATHNRFDAFGDEEADMEDEQDEDGGEEDTEVLPSVSGTGGRSWLPRDGG